MRNKITLYSLLFFLLIGICMVWGQEKTLSAGEKQYIAIEDNGETVYRWLTIHNVKDYDNAGNLIHENDSYTHKWYEYDAKGKKICCKIESQWRGEVHYAEEHYEYNSNGYLIHMQKKGSGEQHKTTYQYYKDKDIIYCTDSDGLIYTYDNKGYLLTKKRKNSNYGGTVVATFNDDGTVTMGGKNTNEFSEEYLYKYDAMGNVIYEEYKTSGKIDNIQVHKYDYTNDRIYSYRRGRIGNYVLESIHLLEYCEDGKTLKKDTKLLVDIEQQGLWYPLY